MKRRTRRPLKVWDRTNKPVSEGQRHLIECRYETGFFLTLNGKEEGENLADYHRKLGPALSTMMGYGKRNKVDTYVWDIVTKKERRFYHETNTWDDVRFRGKSPGEKEFDE